MADIHQILDRQKSDFDRARKSGGGPVDGSGGPPHDGSMDARVSKLESDLTAIKIDLAVVKANGASKADIADLKGATKSDIADLKGSTKSDISDLKGSTKSDISDLKGSTKGDIAEAKTAIIMWVVGAIFVAQLLPMVKDFLHPAQAAVATAPAAASSQPPSAKRL